jgi:hypothetical protein
MEKHHDPTDPKRPNPDISHYLCLIEQICARLVGLSAGKLRRGVVGRESDGEISGLRRQRMRGLGGPGDDAAIVTRAGSRVRSVSRARLPRR